MGIKGKVDRVRNKAVEQREAEDVLAFTRANQNRQDPDHPGMHHQRAYDRAKAFYSELRSDEKDVGKTKEKNYLRIALADKQLPDGLIEDCFHPEERARKEAYTRLKHNVIAAVEKSKPKEQVVYVPELPRQEAARQLTHERKEAIKAELFAKGLIGNDYEFDALIEGVHPEKILSGRRPTFVEQVEGFRILQDPEAAKAKYTGGTRAALGYEGGPMDSIVQMRKKVWPRDFATMVNNSLLTPPQLQRLKGPYPDIAAASMIPRIVRMEPQCLVGFGLGNFSNCCNFNTAIQTMVRTIPPKQIQMMRGN